MVPVAEVVGFRAELDARTAQALFQPLGDFDWRGETRNRMLSMDRENPVNGWHRDGDWSGPNFSSPYAIIVWSNREQTEVMDARTAEILKFRPGEIVLIRNRKAYHRMPPVISPDRCFVRVWGVKVRKVQQWRVKHGFDLAPCYPGAVQAARVRFPSSLNYEFLPATHDREVE